MKYLYTGPTSGVTLNAGNEILLHKGEEVELPANNDYVKTLIALGYLNEIQVGTETKSDKKTKGGIDAG
ncbi:MAG: hypothetical protein PHC34_02800 [Candidatus Gastranaerophilales bacterium]|nr:hypothetical protein [Candidatus Gastranaerophilales bacterium]